MPTSFGLRHPVTILVTDLTSHNNLTNDLLILNLVIYFKLYRNFQWTEKTFEP